MFKKNNFAIKLSKEKIELLKKHNGDYFSLCTVNPNSTNLNSDLNSLLKQYLALSNGKKVVDVILPDELVIKQNILTNEEISFKKAAILLAKNCEMSTNELSVISGPISSNRSQTIVAVTKKSIYEAKEFVKSIGFVPQNFFSLKYVPEIPNDLIFFSEEIENNNKYKEIINNHRLKIISFFIFFPFSVYLLFFSNIFLFNEKNLNKSAERSTIKAPLQKSFNEENNILKDKVLKIFPPYVNTTNKTLKMYENALLINKNFFPKQFEKFEKISPSNQKSAYTLQKSQKIQKGNKKFLYVINQRNKKDEKSRNKNLSQIIKKETIQNN